ncbi:hypothetical protein H8356DRAFT_1302204 [Neocallimastix lanati (nom. inval.)]|uniref:MULE transposase domain-containing protein n=1 Tax=Neocallimastix californiae TaxID=1754190 RepID=A0A1Y2F733_9FUNG|nr:hypothetical protein H8356DRAFT_1020127 [Neocallimastix sp. JGI-2020a]ORY21661.1 hypothetical protein LY90DRAFT_515965 [Neocallimastix californiae]KAG4083445.1 hypothetical protein H8356DRAFT_1017561 [Neocallimastix sp. JGI-2020a]KAG4084313.1 hypothetical protein H8356DRAFT_1016239 [Neocallimastix sp. JGI-2020a]KAG4084446.1 hypothetical protein H8356DRAFT_1318232 [Neocallimastix sp. JGI-2020a]|eukprot:ORY21661.1 hypothetical protein LY90DRAFT_515965 [Neocallimastix californiae]
MEGNLKIDISETNRGKEQIIIDRKFKYNFSKLKKDNTKIYRCTEYKTLNKCKSFIILNDNKEVLNYDSSHNHPGNEINASKSLIKHKIKDEIKKSLIPSDIKSKRIFDKISQEIGYICPEYKTIKSQITRYKNKQLFPNVKTFDEVPNVSEYYKTIRGEYFMIFKNSNIIIFQSPFQAKLFMENKHIFADGTFLIAPTNSYQVFITRTYVTELNCFYTTSMSILKNKEQTTYEILFNEIKKNIIKYNANINFSEKIFHCDFEKGISNAVENIFPNINIKYCFWHYKRLLMTKKNKLCYKEVKDHNILNTYYKAISNLCFINIEYIPDIFNKIKNTCMRYKSTCSQFLNFLDYFEKTFLNIYNIKYWNYYNNIDHITNNASESYNSYLKNLFVKKPSFYKLIYTIQFEESKSYYDYHMRIKGIWRKKSRISERVDDINILVEYYKNMEAELKNIGCSKNDIIENWFNCLIRLNNEIINFNKTK